MQRYTEDATRVPHGKAGKGISTALYEPLLDAVVNMAVTGLYGCSSVVVLSKKGIYMSHFWERPSFTGAKAVCDRQVLQPLKDGDGPQMPGLLALSQDNGIFAPSSEPATFIITPRKALDWDDPDDTRPQYPSQVDRIKALLKSLIGGPAGSVEPTVLTYIAQRDPEDPHRKNRVSGKILFQYDPHQPLPPSTDGKGCVEPRPQPMLRLWVAASGTPVFEKTWEAFPHQLRPSKRGLSLDPCGIPNPEISQVSDSQESSHELATQIPASASIAFTRRPHPQLPSIDQSAPVGNDSSGSSSTAYQNSTITVAPVPLSSSIVYQTSTITVVPVPFSSSIVYRMSTITVVPIPLSSLRKYRTSTITVIPLPQSTVTTRHND